jgi:hypothetical protein
MVWLAIILLVAGGGAWWWWRNQNTKPVEIAAPASKPIPIWAKRVTIPSGMLACQAAQEAGETHFPLDQLPSLPLTGCTQRSNCHCRLQPVADQRTHGERRSGVERRPHLRFDLSASQRRCGQDRRKENYNPFVDQFYH